MSKTSSLKFVKMTGAGNDFVFFNDSDSDFAEKWQAHFAEGSRAEAAQEICDRHRSVGADGLVFLKKLGPDEIEWDFYNADGSYPKMCGNAARCAALYAFEILKCKAPLTLHTRAGDVRAELSRRQEVVVSMPRVIALQREEAITVGKNSYTYEIGDTGVPHSVVKVASLSDREELLRLVERLRFPPNQTTSEGTNVTFVELKQSYLKAVTFERGVEDFTQACGTGAVAARWHMRDQFSMKNELKVVMPGGDLIVGLEKAPPYWHATLGGSAKFTFMGTLF